MGVRLGLDLERHQNWFRCFQDPRSQIQSVRNFRSVGCGRVEGEEVPTSVAFAWKTMVMRLPLIPTLWQSTMASWEIPYKLGVLMRTSSANGGFSVAMFVYQRVMMLSLNRCAFRPSMASMGSSLCVGSPIKFLWQSRLRKLNAIHREIGVAKHKQSRTPCQDMLRVLPCCHYFHQARTCFSWRTCVLLQLAFVLHSCPAGPKHNGSAGRIEPAAGSPYCQTLLSELPRNYVASNLQFSCLPAPPASNLLASSCVLLQLAFVLHSSGHTTVPQGQNTMAVKDRSCPRPAAHTAKLPRS